MELSRLLEDLVAAGAPGAAIRVDDGREIFREARGVADLRTGRPMDVDLRFRAGSATKAFVAAVVLQLVAERQLALGDPIERWLPGITPQGRRIVVRHLLEHSSGLPDYLPAIARVVHDSERACMHTWTPRELVALVAHQPLLFAPGTAWAYANTGYVLLGLLVEAVTGASLADELARRIFLPLDLRGTSFPIDTPEVPEPMAHGYGIAPDPTALADVTRMNPSWAWAAGALISNLEDLAMFFRAALRGTPRSMHRTAGSTASPAASRVT